MNEYLSDFIGYTAKEKVILDAHKFIFEQKKKFCSIPGIAAASLVTCQEPGTKEILSIGASVPTDLINDNFGRLFAGLFAAPTGSRTVSIQDLGNVSRTLKAISSSVNDMWTDASVANGTKLQIGQGTTPPARSDFDIETVFANGGPEDSDVATGNGGYNASLGLVTVNGLIAATVGAGSVSETIIILECMDSTGVSRKMLWSHDAISPVVSFLAGKNVSVDYLWQF